MVKHSIMVFKPAACVVKMRQQTPCFSWGCGNGATFHFKMQTAAEGTPVGTRRSLSRSEFALKFCPLRRLNICQYLPVFSLRRCFFLLLFWSVFSLPHALIPVKNKCKRVFGVRGPGSVPIGGPIGTLTSGPEVATISIGFFQCFCVGRF